MYTTAQYNVNSSTFYLQQQTILIFLKRKRVFKLFLSKTISKYSNSYLILYLTLNFRSVNVLPTIPLLFKGKLSVF